VPAQVMAVDRGRYTCLRGSFDDPHATDVPSTTDVLDLSSRTVTAMKARELGRAGIVVGDRVALVGDVTGRPGSLARVVRVEPRTSMLRRSADDTDPVERGVVANADQLAVVTALARPQPRPRMVDRCLVAALDAGMDTLLLLTKADLAPPGPFLTSYVDLAVAALVTARDADGVLTGVDDVRAALAGRVTVLVGHSGVGKSSLVNQLVPGAARSIGAVNDVTGRGRHTSSSAVALPLPQGGWVVDTPGVRSFGLAHVDPDRIIRSFAELAPGSQECPRGCSHDEPECALDDYVAAGGAGPAGASRLNSLRRLLRSRAGSAEETPER